MSATITVQAVQHFSLKRVKYCPFTIVLRGMPKELKRRNDDEAGNKAKKPAFGQWAKGLLIAMEDPNLRIYDDSQVVVIKDKYPKAKFHYLVLPKAEISSLKEIGRDHLGLLKHMHQVGEEIIQRKDHENSKFKMGYHAEPSMHQLHLHLISDDFCSDCLKTKKHYNSFTTDHFIDSKKILECVKDHGKIIIPSPADCQQFLRQPLVCFKCCETFPTMPKLKEHLRSHSSD